MTYDEFNGMQVGEWFYFKDWRTYKSTYNKIISTNEYDYSEKTLFEYKTEIWMSKEHCIGNYIIPLRIHLIQCNQYIKINGNPFDEHNFPIVNAIF